MKTEIKVAIIAGAVAIIVTLINIYSSDKPDTPQTPVAAPQIQVGTTQGRVTNNKAEKVNYSEKDMIFNNGKQSK
jgi:hypothetical protein